MGALSLQVAWLERSLHDDTLFLRLILAAFYSPNRPAVVSNNLGVGIVCGRAIL